MTEDVYQALRDAVNLARFEQVRNIAQLKSRLQLRGYSYEVATEAIRAWANYERGKQC